MPSEERKFKTGDKVFAKVRGYPAWPARVEGLADETPGKCKYHVFFFGTSEVGVCRSDEIFPYIESKVKYGKAGIKRRFFTEALMAIEAEIEAETGESISKLTEATSQSTEKTDSHIGSDNEGNLIIDEDTDKSKMKTVATPKSFTPGGNFQRPQPSPVRVTTSGRKIKPKKTFDPDDDDITFSSQSYGYKPLTSTNDTENAPIKESVVRVKPSNESLIILDINKFTPPEGCKTDKAIDVWKVNKLNEFKKVKEKIESGQPVLNDEYEEIINQQLEPEAQEEILKREAKRRDSLKIEVDLLRIDLIIKGCLNSEGATAQSVKKAVTELNKLLELPLTPLMLKKHPEIVDTISRVQRFHGNIGMKKLPEEVVEEFNRQTAQVREKADQVYNRFKSLFAVPDNITFWEYFATAFLLFNKATQNMPPYDLYALIDDPTQ